jgi:hypothetical protein
VPVMMTEIDGIPEIRLLSFLWPVLPGAYQHDLHALFQHILHWNPVRARALHGHATTSRSGQPPAQVFQRWKGGVEPTSFDRRFFVGWTR